MNEPYGFCQVVVGQEHQEIVQGLDVQSIKESMYVMNINPIAYLSRYFEQGYWLHLLCNKYKNYVFTKALTK